jgi:hypothetical protein
MVEVFFQINEDLKCDAMWADKSRIRFAATAHHLTIAGDAW